MPLEIPTTIKDLYPNYPFDGDLVAQGREHLIYYKTAVVNTFPLIDSAIETTEIYLQNILGKITLVDNSIVFNTPVYQRASGINDSNTLRELYITKTQEIKPREPLPPLGTVIQSALRLADINKLYGKDKEDRDRWAALAGQTITGSKLQVEFGITALKDAFTNKVFLAAPKTTETVNTLYPFNTNVTPIKITLKTDTHGDAQHPGTHKHEFYQDGTNTEGNRREGGTGMTQGWADDRPFTKYNYTTAALEHNHVFIPTWGTETAPKAYKINYFIRIN